MLWSLLAGFARFCCSRIGWCCLGLALVATSRAVAAERPLDLSLPPGAVNLAFAPRFLPHPFPRPAEADPAVEPEYIYSEDGDYEEEEDYSPGYIDRSVNYLLDQHHFISTTVEVMGRNIDNYFAGDQALAEENETYMRVRLSQQWIDGAEWNSENDLKFRLDLPATKDRYRLVLSYRPDEEDTLEERTRPSVSSQPRDQSQSLFAGAVRTATNEARNWETRMSAGIKVRMPLDPFVRANGRREFRLGEHWLLNIRSGASWFNTDGIRADHSWAFDRIVAHDKLFRASTLTQWREDEDTLKFAQLFDLFHTLDFRRLVNYRIGVVGESWSASRIDNYYASVIYRQDLYRQWLYLNVVPEIAFPREDDFDEVMSITVGIEIFFNQF